MEDHLKSDMDSKSNIKVFFKNNNITLNNITKIDWEQF